MSMSVAEYYKHVRKITDGRGKAEDCFRLAKEAVALDKASAERRLAEARKPDMVSVEVLPDGSEISLSRGVFVF